MYEATVYCHHIDEAYSINEAILNKKLNNGNNKEMNKVNAISNLIHGKRHPTNNNGTHIILIQIFLD